MKNMAYWKAKNGVAPAKKDEGGPLKMKASPFKQIQTAPADTTGTFSVYDDPALLNPQGQNQSQVVEGRRDAHTRAIATLDKFVLDVDAFAQENGMSVQDSTDARARYDMLYNNVEIAAQKFQATADSLGIVNEKFLADEQKKRNEAKPW